jgi:hypothetical protein
MLTSQRLRTFIESSFLFFVTANISFLAAENEHLKNLMRMSRNQDFSLPSRRVLSGLILERVVDAERRHLIIIHCSVSSTFIPKAHPTARKLKRTDMANKFNLRAFVSMDVCVKEFKRLYLCGRQT